MFIAATDLVDTKLVAPAVRLSFVAARRSSPMRAREDLGGISTPWAQSAALLLGVFRGCACPVLLDRRSVPVFRLAVVAGGSLLPPAAGPMNEPLQLREQPQAWVVHSACLVDDSRGCPEVIDLLGVDLEGAVVGGRVLNLLGEERRDDPEFLEKRLERLVSEGDLDFAFGRYEYEPHRSAGLPPAAGRKTEDVALLAAEEVTATPVSARRPVIHGLLVRPTEVPLYAVHPVLVGAGCDSVEERGDSLDRVHDGEIGRRPPLGQWGLHVGSGTGFRTWGRREVTA